MRVVQINVTFGVGSTGRIAKDIHNYLSDQDIESHVIYGRNPYLKGSNIYHVGNILSFYLDVLLTRFTGLVGYFSFIPTLITINKIKHIKPNIIHLHNIHGYYLNIPMLLRFLAKFSGKLVWTLHDEFIYTGKCAHTESCSKYLKECQTCPLVKEYPKSLWFDWSRLMFNQKKKLIAQLKSIVYVTPSNWLANKTVGSLISGQRIEVINNGIRTESFKKMKKIIETKSSSSKIRLLTLIANLDNKIKGHHWIEKFASEIDNEQFEFYVVGSGKIHYQHPSIHYIERTNSLEELVCLYNSADYFLILSEHDNYPTVCLEASSIGLPIIGFDIGGVKEAIVNTPYKLFSYGDKNIIPFISELKKNSLDGFEMASKKNLDYSHMTSQYLKIYEELIHD